MATELLTEAQLADYLQVTRRTVQTWRMRGTGPAWIKVGEKAVRYAMADVQAYLNARRHEPGQGTGRKEAD